MSNRRLYLYLVSLVIASLVWSYFTAPRDEKGDVIHYHPKPGEKVSISAWPTSAEELDKSHQNEQEQQESHSQTLQKQMAELYKQTFPNGDMSQQQQMRLEDDWCIASSDLQATEYEHYLEQLDEWLLERGNITLPSPNNDINMSTQTRRNASFISPYAELPAKTLIQHASNNDLLAVSVIAQRDDFPPEIKDKAAKQLLLLGDTSKGLTRLVMNELSQITALNEDNSNRNTITRHFIKALAMVKYGLQRKDTSALQAFLIYAQKPDRFLKDNWPQDFIFSEEADVIGQVANKMHHDINVAREQINLPHISLENESRIVDMHYQEKLAFLMHHYQETLGRSWFPDTWQEEFIPQSDCMKRKVATSRFWQEQAPALQKRISDAEKSSANTLESNG